MNSFIAKITFQIICGAGDHRPQFDEQLRLIFAENSELAFESALQLGEAEQSSFYNRKEQLVQWKFCGVANLLSVELEHGAEIHSGIVEADDAAHYTKEVRMRAEGILEKMMDNR